MHSEAFSIGMWSGAGFEKVAANKGTVVKNINRAWSHVTGGKKTPRGKAGKPKPRAPKAPPGTEPGFFDSLTPGKIGLGLGIPAGLLGYMAGSEPATLPPPPTMMNPLMMQMMQGGMYGMPGGQNQMSMPPSARLPY